MHRTFFALLLVTASSLPGQRVSLDRANSATLVFDARSREFRCWSEGSLERGAPCHTGADWHPMTAALHFTRGEMLTVLVTSGVVQDIFSVEVKADDLAAPTTPVSGALAELPKLQAIPALETIFAGVNASLVTTKAASLVAGCQARDPLGLLGLAPTATKEDFKAALDNWILNPLGATEVTNLLALDLANPITTIQQAGPYTQIAESIVSEVHKIALPLTIEDWVAASKSLSVQVDRATALRTRIASAGVPVAVKAINDALLAERTTNVECATSISAQSLNSLLTQLTKAFGDKAHAAIDAITVSGSHFVVPPAHKEMQPLLENIESALKPTNPSNDQLKALKTNLALLADNLSAIKLASTRRAALETLVKATLPGADLLLQCMRQSLAPLTDTLTTRAASIDSVGNVMPLPRGYDRLPLGQWFANKTLTITIKQGARLRQFDVGAVSDATRIVVGGDQPATKATSPAVADLAPTRTLTVPVYDTYHVKMGLGFAYSTVRDDRYQVSQLTTGKGDAAVTQQFIDQTRSRPSTLLPTVTVTVFPFARQDFPWRARYDGESDAWYKDVGATIGFGLNTPVRDFLLGGTWMRQTSPVGVQFAWHIAIRDRPPEGVELSKPLPDTTRIFTLRQTTTKGFSGGLVFTTDFFTKIFASIFKAAA
jgi:hypothetical protein